MPTTRPRYTITDTGPLQTLLDYAERRWPEVGSRKELLLLLAETGHESLRISESKADMRDLRERQSTALDALRSTVDWDAIRNDEAWR